MLKSTIRKIILIAAIAFTTSSHATVIGVFGGYSSKSSLINNLTNMGHTVTDLGVNVTSDLSAFDSVWGVSAFDVIDATEQNFLFNYLLSGGGLYLTGERPCCEALNSSVTNFVNSVLDTGTVQIGGIGDQGSSATVNQNVVGNLANNPNLITSWSPNASGGISGVSGDNVFATSNSTGNTVAAAWQFDDLVGDLGKLVVMMDVNWLSGTSQLAALENIETFLSSEKVSAPVPSPSVLLLFSLSLIAMGIARRKKHQP